LLANAGFILKPDFDRPAGKLRWDCGARQPGEVYGMARPFGQPRYCCWRFEGREKSDEDCNSRN